MGGKKRAGEVLRVDHAAASEQVVQSLQREGNLLILLHLSQADLTLPKVAAVLFDEPGAHCFRVCGKTGFCSKYKRTEPLYRPLQ